MNVIVLVGQVIELPYLREDAVGLSVRDDGAEGRQAFCQQ